MFNLGAVSALYFSLCHVGSGTSNMFLLSRSAAHLRKWRKDGASSGARPVDQSATETAYVGEWVRVNPDGGVTRDDFFTFSESAPPLSAKVAVSRCKSQSACELWDEFNSK